MDRISKKLKNRLDKEVAILALAGEDMRSFIAVYGKRHIDEFLCVLCNTRYIELVKIVIEAGANVNFLSGLPLRMAIGGKHYDIIALLMDNGATYGDKGTFYGRI